MKFEEAHRRTVLHNKWLDGASLDNRYKGKDTWHRVPDCLHDGTEGECPSCLYSDSVEWRERPQPQSGEGSVDPAYYGHPVWRFVQGMPATMVVKRFRWEEIVE